MKSLVFALAIATTALGGIGLSSTADARDWDTIMDPYTAKYGDWKKIRKALRKRQKAGETFNGDDWFVLAAMCAIEPPEGPSRILNFTQRSPCKKDVPDYFARAGMNGTPLGFYWAAYYTRKYGGSDADAWRYAELGSRFADGDMGLTDRMFEMLGSIRIGQADMQQQQGQVDTLARRLVADGIYPASSTAGQATLANADLPSFGWLDFKNPRRCQFSDGWQRFMEGSYSFDPKSYLTVPATTTVPGTQTRTTGRIVRPEKEWESVVRVEADARGRWNGLTVLGAFTTFVEESHGVWGDGIRFAEPVDVVARRLTALGFVVNPDGSERRQVDKVEKIPYMEGGVRKVAENIDGVITRIERHDGATYFFCDEIFEASYGA
ncbi:hypothetical protein [Qipengyuania sp. JC766]|uniref:hypothetical protein n=1 Tax=Qipengyuania sp. JC766 TaxID=3232139 RepID=UPI00345765F0